MIPLIIAATLATPAAAQTCTDPFCNAKALAPFFRALDDVQAGRRERPVHVIQIGDSHTANDYITGALRDRLQFKFGRGGRGVLPPGSPYAGYEPRLVQTAQDAGWQTELSFAPAPSPNHPEQPRLYAAPPPFGLTGFRMTANTPATMTLDAEADAAFTQATVCALAGPGAGVITLSAGETRHRLPLDAAAVQPVCRTVSFPAPQQHLQLATSDGPVSVLSWATFGNSGGLAYSNLGVSGTQLRDLAARSDAVLAAEFDAYKPDLIVLAYGTNEGYVPAADTGAYEALLKSQLERLKRLSHGTPILVLGAPDAETLRPDLYGTGGTFPECATLSDDEVRNYSSLVADRSPLLAHWYPPAGLAEIRAVQRPVAVAEDDAFWDWGARMGGPCSAHQMSLTDPRLVRGDHIHFTAEGGVKIADLLFGDLMQAMTTQAGER